MYFFKPSAILTHARYLLLFTTFLASYAKAQENNEIVDSISITVEALKTENQAEETPKSVSIIGREDLNEHGVQKLDEAFRYTSGITTPYGSDNDAEWFFVRGFEPSMYLDGNRLYKEGFFAWTIEPFGLESIELVKGPSSMLYGESMPGGVVNVVQKKPTNLPQSKVSVTGGNKNHMQLGVDTSNWLNKDGSQRYRMVTMINQKEGELDGTESKRIYLAPSYTVDFNDNTSLTILASYLRDEGVPENGFFPADGVFKKLPNGGLISPNTNFGEPDYDNFNKQQFSLGYQLSHDFNSVITYNQNFNFAYNELYLRSSSAYPDYDGDPYTISRYTLINDGSSQSYTFDNNILAKWNTKQFEYQVLTGFDIQHHTNDWIGNGNGVLVGQINVLNPTYGNIIDLSSGLYKNDITKNQVGVYTQLQSTWRDKVLVNIGTRYDVVEIENQGNVKDKINDGQLSFNAGVMYLADNGLSPYMSYSESFYVISSIDWVTNKLYKPVESSQYEVGLKYTPKWFNGFINLAWFDIEQKNATVSAIATDGTLATSQTGKVKNQGFEVEAQGKITKDLKLTANYTYIDSRQGENLVRQSLIPYNLAVVWALYDLSNLALNGLVAGGGVRYAGESIDSSTSEKVPDYLLIDMMVSYKINKKWDFQFNINNLTNEVYIAGCDYGICYYGESRKVLATLNYNF